MGREEKLMKEDEDWKWQNQREKRQRRKAQRTRKMRKTKRTKRCQHEWVLVAWRDQQQQ